MKCALLLSTCLLTSCLGQNILGLTPDQRFAIYGGVATATGHPEIGVPLSAMSAGLRTAAKNPPRKPITP